MPSFLERGFGLQHALLVRLERDLANDDRSVARIPNTVRRALDLISRALCRFDHSGLGRPAKHNTNAIIAPRRVSIKRVLR
jgi:hypothetical protein